VQFQKEKKILFNVGHWTVLTSITKFTIEAHDRLVESKIVERMLGHQRKCFKVIFQAFKDHVNLKNRVDPLRIK